MAKDRVTVADLKDQFNQCLAPFLYCTKCGAQNSAHAGDYFQFPNNHVFKCCKRNMILAHIAVIIRPDNAK